MFLMNGVAFRCAARYMDDVARVLVRRGGMLKAASTFAFAVG
jgi:hypothetical protein